MPSLCLCTYIRYSPAASFLQLEQARALQRVVGLGIEESLTALRANNFNHDAAIA